MSEKEKISVEEAKKRLGRINESIRAGKLNFKEAPHAHLMAMAEKAKLTAILEEAKIRLKKDKVKIAYAEARRRKNGVIFRQGMVVWKFFPEMDPKTLELKLREKFGDKPLKEEEKS